MKNGTLRVDGGVVIGWNGEGHELLPGGSVLIEGDKVTYAGYEKRPADHVIDASGKLVSPGFINLHVHTQLNIGDYLVTDVTKRDYLGANYFVYGAPPKDRRPDQTPEGVKVGREFAMLSALRNGSTTILDPGGGAGDYDDYVDLVDKIGLRSFFSPRYRSHDTYTDADGGHYYDERSDKGRQSFDEAMAFIEKNNGACDGRLQAILSPNQAETCDAAMLQETAAMAKKLNLGIHTHVGGNAREFIEIVYRAKKSPMEYLYENGVLGEKTIVGHAVFVSGHSGMMYPVGDEVEILAETGTTVGHCPHKYAKMGFALESFDRYLQQGVNVGLGTDTYPLDIIAEMRYASRIARVVDGTHMAGRPEDLFNAATVWGANALGRPDLGRLAEGSAADLLVIDLQDISYGPMRDPVTALVDFGTGKDVETVIVAGEVVIEGGTSTRVDEADIYARAQAAATAGWDGWAKRDWANRDVETITPPAFPTRSTGK